MRLFLLPISTRRTLIYSKKLNVTITDKENLLDKATTRAAALWAGWEKKESGWQKRIVTFGNAALKRIPYEEWGLKSIPPLSKRRAADELTTKDEGKVEVSFPKSVIPESKVLAMLNTMGTERQSLHKQRMVYCFIGMPISAPFMLVPVIPNLPFFYLVFRAWSHWRALSGSQHIMFLLKNQLIDVRPSPVLDSLYSQRSLEGPVEAGANASGEQQKLGVGGEPPEVMLLDKERAEKIAQELEMPELSTELERAIWQVETAIKSKEEKAAAETGAAETGSGEKSSPEKGSVEKSASDKSASEKDAKEKNIP